MRTWLRTVIGGLGLVAALAIATVAPPTAEAQNVRPPAPSVFPAYQDPWRSPGVVPAPSVFDPWRVEPRPHYGYRHEPRVFVTPQPVWVQPYWAWTGYRWVWVPGYWAY